jgi:hypothetical protein
VKQFAYFFPRLFYLNLLKNILGVPLYVSNSKNSLWVPNHLPRWKELFFYSHRRKPKSEFHNNSFLILNHQNTISNNESIYEGFTSLYETECNQDTCETNILTFFTVVWLYTVQTVHTNTPAVLYNNCTHDRQTCEFWWEDRRLWKCHIDIFTAMQSDSQMGKTAHWTSCAEYFFPMQSDFSNNSQINSKSHKSISHSCFFFFMRQIKITISCLSGSENHVRSLLDHHQRNRFAMLQVALNCFIAKWLLRFTCKVKVAQILLQRCFCVCSCARTKQTNCHASMSSTKYFFIAKYLSLNESNTKPTFSVSRA